MSPFDLGVQHLILPSLKDGFGLGISGLINDLVDSSLPPIEEVLTETVGCIRVCWDNGIVSFQDTDTFGFQSPDESRFDVWGKGDLQHLVVNKRDVVVCSTVKTCRAE